MLRLHSAVEEAVAHEEREFEQIRPTLDRQPHGVKTIDSEISRGFRSFGAHASLFLGLPHMALYRRAEEAEHAAYSGCREDIDELKKLPWKRMRRRLATIKRSIQGPSGNPDTCVASLRAIQLELRQRSERLGRVVEALRQAATQVAARAAALARAGEQYLQALEHLFNKAQNPVFPWLAYDFARRTGRPKVPQWVAKYLDGVAATIIARVGAGDEMALTLWRGGRGRGNIVKKAEQASRDLGIAMAVQERIDNGAKLYIARSDVEKALGHSEPTVRRAYARNKEIVRLLSAPVTKPGIS